MFKLSVALCTYNGSRFLREQLESIAAQTRTPDELVVCDDGSTDSTLQVLEDFRRGARFPVRLYPGEKPLGSTGNFERAIGLCTGQLMALCDQDDVWRSDRLSATESAFLSDPDVSGFFTDADIVDASLNPLGYRLWDVVRFGRTERARWRQGEVVPLLLRRNVVTGATLAFKSELRKLILPIPRGWAHDAWIALLIGATGKLAFGKEPLIQYRQHSSNQRGALKRGYGEQLDEARAPHAEIYAAAAANYMAARERLLAATDVPVPRQVTRSLDAKIAHMQTRAALPRSRIRRLPIVLSELAAGRYRCYSNSWKSFARDVWF
jgi:glycosyltransferase involved in cell wall biosynthesis